MNNLGSPAAHRTDVNSRVCRCLMRPVACIAHAATHRHCSKHRGSVRCWDLPQSHPRISSRLGAAFGLSYLLRIDLSTASTTLSCMAPRAVRGSPGRQIGVRECPRRQGRCSDAQPQSAHSVDLRTSSRRFWAAVVLGSAVVATAVGVVKAVHMATGERGSMATVVGPMQQGLGKAAELQPEGWPLTATRE